MLIDPNGLSEEELLELAINESMEEEKRKQNKGMNGGGGAMNNTKQTLVQQIPKSSNNK